MNAMASNGMTTQAVLVVHATIVSIIFKGPVVVSVECGLPYGRCPDGPCTEAKPLECFDGKDYICVAEKDICNGSCDCFLLSCEDESDPLCAEKRIQTVKRVLPYAGLLALPIGIAICYFCICGGRNKRQGEGSDQESALPINDADEACPQMCGDTPRHRVLSASASNPSSRSRSNSNIALSSRPNFYSLPRRDRRHRNPDRAYGIGSVSLVHSPQASVTGRAGHLHPNRSQSARDYRRIVEERNMGGSLRIPLSFAGRSEQAVARRRSLTDAPPSYSDTCIHSQSNCLTVPREFWSSLRTGRPKSEEAAPPTYTEVLEENYPLFSSVHDIQCSSQTDNNSGEATA